MALDRADYLARLPATTRLETAVAHAVALDRDTYRTRKMTA
jgi:hypothetical protein